MEDSVLVRSTKSSTDSRSARRSKTGALLSTESVSSGFSALRSVFRRWLNAVFTTVLKSFSSHPREVREFRLSRMTADCTFGGGQNAPEPTGII